MKTETMGVDITPNKKQQKDLSIESKEANHVDMKAGHPHRQFGVMDMWYIQKRQRTAASMLRRLQ